MRIEVWRQTYGPGERPTGARFRDEITVCSSCHRTNIAKLWPAGSGCLGRWVEGEPFGHYERCTGNAYPPTAALGWRWL